MYPRNFLHTPWVSSTPGGEAQIYLISVSGFSFQLLQDVVWLPLEIIPLVTPHKHMDI